MLEEGDGPSASEDSLAFSEDSLSSSSSFLHFRSSQVLSAHLLYAHPNLRLILSLHPSHLILIVVIVTICLIVLAKRKRFLLSNLCWSNIQLTMAFITVSHLKMNLLDTRKGSLIVLNNSGRILYLLPYIRRVTTNASRYICDTAQFS